MYWLELLQDGGVVPREPVAELPEETNPLSAVFGTCETRQSPVKLSFCLFSFFLLASFYHASAASCQ